MYRAKVGLEYIIKRSHWCVFMCAQSIRVHTSDSPLNKAPSQLFQAYFPHGGCRLTHDSPCFDKNSDFWG